MGSLLLSAFVKLQTMVSLQSLLVAVVAILSVFLLKISKSGKNPPPGPFSIPLFGSIFVLPGLLSPWRRHRSRVELALKYGKIYQFQMGKMKVVFLNEVALIKEAFISKGEIISDRLRPEKDDNSMQAVLAGKGIGNTDYGKDFKERKTLTLHSMKDFGFGGKSLEETTVEETVFLKKRFQQVADTSVPTDIHMKLMHLSVSNVISSVVFGRRFDYDDDAFNKAVNGIKFLFSQNSGFLRRIPLITKLPAIKKKLAKDREQGNNVRSFVEDQIQLHKEEFDPNCPRDFIDLCLLKEREDQEIGQKSRIGTENIKKIIIDLFFAGTDTTAASMGWFLLYMIRFPEVQRKCQKEIDEVLDVQGDLANVNVPKCLPYTTATLFETQRIASIAPSSLPHIVREDTTLGGYDVEKGSLVFANIRHIHLDKAYWGNPDEFVPERWLDPADQTKVIQHTNFVPFSLGKRRCLGENLAKVEYSVFAISLLRSFSFKMVDPSNPPTLEGFGLLYSPKPYEMLVESRNVAE